MDTLYLVNTTSDTINIDSIYLDSNQIVNGKVNNPYCSGFGVGFTTFPLDTTNHFSDYLIYGNHNYKSQKQIKLLPGDSLGLTNFEVDNLIVTVSKKLAKVAIFKTGDTLTLRLVFKTTNTTDTLTCVGLITHLPSAIINCPHHEAYPTKTSTKLLYNAIGQRLTRHQQEKYILSPTKTFINCK